MDNDDVQVGKVLSRREVLALLGGTALLAACEPAARSLATPTPGTTAAATAVPAATGTGPAVAVPSCVVRPALAAGPFFVDTKLDRSDIRSDPATGAVSAGVPLVLTFAVARVSGSACTALPGAIVDLWQCDAAGVYSDVPGSQGRRFLRGFQTTDAQGRARFTTIYPGWYPGRTVHLHFKVRSGQQEFVSQLFFDDALTDTIFREQPYAQRPNRTTRNANDGVFNASRGQLTLQATRSGDGYAATFEIGLAS